MKYIAVDLGGTRIKMASFSDYKIEFEEILPAFASEPMGFKLSLIENQIRNWYENAEGEVQGISISIPGIVDTHQAKVVSINGKHLDAPKTDFKGWAREAFNCPLIIMNDAISALAGEWKVGAAVGSDNVIMLTLGTGIGTGAIVDGKLLVGARFFAGNLAGHFALERLTETYCTCGARGCAEAFASTWSSSKDLRVLWEEHENGDRDSTLQLEAILRTWAILIHNMILAYSPERVVIGGGISARGPELLKEIREFMPKNVWYDAEDIDWRIAEHPDFAGLYGGVYSMVG